MSKSITTRTTAVARPTLKSTNERIDALDSKLDAILGHLAGQAVTPVTPAVTVQTVQGEVLSVTDTPVTKKGKKAKATKVAASTRCLVQANRLDFIADHEWAQPGTSTRSLAEQVLLERKPLVGNWMIGPKRAAMILGVDEADLIEQAETPKAVVLAEAKADKPAKRTKAQRKAAKKIAKAPRRADGTITPKREWALREQLSITGYDAETIDKKVAEAYDAPDLAEHFGLVSV